MTPEPNDHPSLDEPTYGSIVLKSPSGTPMYVSLLYSPGSEHKYQIMIGNNVVRTYEVSVRVKDQVLDLGIADLGIADLGSPELRRHDGKEPRP